MNGIFRGRRPVGRPRLRWKENIRRDSSLLVNVSGWKRLSEDRDMKRSGLSGHRRRRSVDVYK